jgi:hypothetical protein
MHTISFQHKQAVRPAGLPRSMVAREFLLLPGAATGRAFALGTWKIPRAEES